MVYDRGLDLSSLDVTTAAEIAEFSAQYNELKGRMLPGYEFWLSLRPDQLKRAKVQYRAGRGEATGQYPLVRLFSMLHLYCVVGHEEGVRYELKLARDAGATRAELLAVIAVAFIHAGPRGMHYVDAAVRTELEDMTETASTAQYPETWSIDPVAFRAGLDFATLSVLPGEDELMRQWYVNTLGEVPRYVSFLLSHRPDLLKGYRCRFEFAASEALPKQMVAYLMLHFSVATGSAHGIREAALLGRGWGMTTDQMVDAIVLAATYGGMNAIDLADQAAGDLLGR